MEFLLKYRNLLSLILIGIFVFLLVITQHKAYPSNQVECVEIADRDIQNGSINTSSGPNNNGPFYSFDIKKASFIQCASKGEYFQYEVGGKDAKGNMRHFYKSFIQEGESNSFISDSCQKVNNDPKGFGSKGRTIRDSEKSSSSTYLGEPTCTYQEGLLQNPTSTYKSS